LGDAFAVCRDLVHDGQGLWTGYVTCIEVGSVSDCMIRSWNGLTCKESRRIRKLVLFHYLQDLLQLRSRGSGSSKPSITCTTAVRGGSDFKHHDSTRMIGKVDGVDDLGLQVNVGIL
jgi:hypothetical protein